MPYVYLITNTITKRTYVGRSCNVRWRIKQHLDSLKGGYHTKALMQEDSYTFGYESFECKILGPYDEHEAGRQLSYKKLKRKYFKGALDVIEDYVLPIALANEVDEENEIDEILG